MRSEGPGSRSSKPGGEGRGRGSSSSARLKPRGALGPLGPAAAPSDRPAQVAGEIRRALQEEFARGLNDPRVQGMVSITEVVLTPDLAEALATLVGKVHGVLNIAGPEVLGRYEFALRAARRTFLKEHGRVFWILGIMQYFWYSSDKRRERFVAMCADPDVQRLTWQAYMNKKLVRADPMAHVRIFLKDTAHLLGLRAAHP